LPFSYDSGTTNWVYQSMVLNGLNDGTMSGSEVSGVARFRHPDVRGKRMISM